MGQKKVWHWLLGLVSLVAVLFVTQLAMPAQAATNHNAKEFTTSASVINGPDFKHADTIDIQYKMAFGETEIKAGDTITIDLPENLRAKTPGDVFDVTDEHGTKIGEAVVSDGKVVVTMNSALEGKTNDTLTVNLATKYRGEDTGEQDVIFDLENGEQNTSVINIVSNEANLSKKGTIQEDGTIKWTILANRQELKMKNLSIADTIGDHQTMVKNVEVYNGEWSSATSYKRKSKLDEDAYNVKFSDDGFNLAFNDTVNNLIVIDYYTKLTDEGQELVDSGYKYRNKAIMTWGGGTSGGPNSEEANGKVSSSNGSSGIGGGTDSSSSSSSNIISSSSSIIGSSSSSLISSSSSSLSSSSSSSVISSSSSSEASSSSSSSVISSSSSSEASSSSSSSEISSSSSSSEASSSSSSSAVSSSSSSESSSSSSSSVNSSNSSSSSVTSSSNSSQSESSNNSSDTNSTSDSSDANSSSEDNNETVTEPDDPEDNTAVNPDTDEDTGTIDVDAGFDDNYDGSTTAPDAGSSSMVSSTSSVFNSSKSGVTTTPEQATSQPETEKSSAKTTVSQADALTPAATGSQTLPQTNESASNDHALKALGLLIGGLTLGTSALLRHWF
ncbi:collagen binding domain-containing protein [Lactiplantibacillus nangangensis]|uniref:Collagen binding domain-containing protein n=1 Tax=Lactiplantibacillus nangangensis TaxID=2559917 RepID=A0ABW1SNH7_9LACO|nr:collagen binding domain-containing protein [Lactiplantibacillus nangangensis]